MFPNLDSAPPLLLGCLHRRTGPCTSGRPRHSCRLHSREGIAILESGKSRDNVGGPRGLSDSIRRHNKVYAYEANPARGLKSWVR